jgi:hypothetical protein
LDRIGEVVRVTRIGTVFVRDKTGQQHYFPYYGGKLVNVGDLVNFTTDSTDSIVEDLEKR